MLAREYCEQDCDETAHDVSVAVTAELKNRSAGLIRPNVCGKPHLAGAALDLIPLRAFGFRQSGERAAELYEIAVAVVPLLQERKILDNFVNVHAAPAPEI